MASCSAALGVDAVMGVLNITEVRKRMSGEAAVRACAVTIGGALAAVALSREPVLTAGALVLGLALACSCSQPAGDRSLASYQAVSSGGIAVGNWAWG